ncbi:bacterio-opsin activator domain-containing protein [Halarchaeum grantii]|nr:bacterio-opsin activator domain-containing protein [Halarchaeum grantii]
MTEDGDGAGTRFRAPADRDVLDGRARALSALFDDGVYHVDASGAVLAVNDVARERLGYEAGALAGSSLATLLGERDAARVRDHLDAAADARVTNRDATRTLDATVRDAAGTRVARTLRVTPVAADGAGVVVAEVPDDGDERAGASDDESQRSRPRDGDVNRFHDAVHEVTAAVIERATRREVERAACERLAASECYECAWLGAPEPRSETVSVRADAGGDATPDAVALSGASDGADSLSGRALEAGEIRTTREHALAEAEAVASAAEAAAIPVVNGETTYGVLVVYADREDAFGAAERGIVARLGRVVGHAIAAAERKRALVSETVVELEFRLHDAVRSLDDAEDPDGTITLERAIPVRDDAFRIYGVADERSVEAVDAMTAAVDEWDEVSVVSEQPDGVRFELRVSDVPVMSEVASLGGAIASVVVDGRDLDMTVHLPEESAVRRVVETIRAVDGDAEPIAQRRVPAHDDSLERLHAVWSEALTERQRTAVESAYFMGYFEWPRETSGSAVAEALGVSPPTFSQHLRAVQRKVFGRLLDDA